MDGFSLLTSRVVLQEDTIRVIARSLANAIKHMHDQALVHRDIKLENFLLMDHLASDIKLADFGFTMQCGQTPPSYQCTPAYVPPEVLHAKQVGYHLPAHRAADMWSLGVTLYTLFTGQYPFGKGITVADHNRILHGTLAFRPDHWIGVFEHAKSIVRSLLVVDVNHRMTVDQMLDAEWMQ